MATKADLEAARKAGKPYPAIETSADVATLAGYEPFKSLGTPAARQQRVVEIRERMLCAIAVVEKEFPDLGKTLRNTWRSGGLCLQFPVPPKPGKKARKVDSSSLKVKGRKGSSVRINFGKFPQNPASPADNIYDRDGFRFIAELVHQACLANAKTGTAAPKKAKDQSLQAQVTELCGTEQALVKDVQWLTEYKRVLTAIISTDQLPANSQGIGKCLGMELLADPNLVNSTARAIKAGRILSKVCSLLGDRTKNLKKTQTLKRSLTQQSSLPLEERPDGYYANLGGAQWLIEETESAEGIAYLISGGGGSYEDGSFVPNTSLEISAYPDDGSEPTVTLISVSGVDTITGAEYDPDNGHLLLCGYNEFGGSIIFVEDTDGDRIPNGPLMFPPHDIGLLRGGVLKIPPDADEGEVLILDRYTNEIFHGSDPNQGDTFRYPSTFMPYGRIGGSVRPVRRLFCTDDRLQIYGSDDSGCGEALIQPGKPLPMCWRPDTSSSFRPGGQIDLFLESDFDPAIDQPMVGARSLGCTGMPFRPLELYFTPAGGARTMISTCTAGPTGGGTFVFPNDPLMPGIIEVASQDPPAGSVPLMIPVANARQFEANFSRPVPQFGGGVERAPLFIQVSGEPGSRVVIQEAVVGMTVFEDTEIITDLDAQGAAIATVQPRDNDQSYYRARVLGGDLSGFKNETITAIPGHLISFNIPQLAGFSPDPDEPNSLPQNYAFELIQAPPDFNGYFAWHGDGESSVSATTNSLGYPISFQIRDGEDLTDIFVLQIEIAPADDYEDVIRFTDEFGNGWVEVPVLVLEDSLHYPVPQFAPRNVIGDVCVAPHWHGHDVLPLENPSGVGADEQWGQCGYGVIFPFLSFQAPTVPVMSYALPEGAWEIWLGEVVP